MPLKMGKQWKKILVGFGVGVLLFWARSIKLALMYVKPLEKLPIALWIAATVAVIAFWIFVARPVDRQTILDTFLLGFGSTLLALMLGAWLASAIYQDGWLGRIALILTLCGAVIPLVWYVSGWDAAFGKLGWIAAGSTNALSLFVPRWFAAVWIHATALGPLVALLLVVQLGFNRRIYEEQGLIDASHLTVLWSITFPRVWPTLVVALMWGVISVSREIVVADIYQIGTIAEQIYLGYSLGQMDQMLAIWPDGAEVLSIPLYCVILIWFATSAILLVCGLSRTVLSGDLAGRSDQIAQNRFWRTISSLTICGLMFGMPLANLFVRAGLRVESLAGKPTLTWTIGGVVESFSRFWAESNSELQWSLAIAFGAASLLLVVGLCSAWCALRLKWVRVCFFGSVIVALTLPGPLIGFAVMTGWGMFNFSGAHWLGDRTIFLPIMATSFFCWPLTGLSLWCLVASIPRDLLQSASTQGASTWGQFWSMVVGLKRNSLIGLWLLFFAISFGELSAQQLVVPPGIDTIPRQLLGWLHSGVDEMAAAASLSIVGLVGLISAIAAVLMSWPIRRRSK
jgi:ABC-type spermidine/putrescine transport system permease subunit II